jgi:SsrA-binding protein
VCYTIKRFDERVMAEDQVVCTNRAAYYRYQIEETYEAGIALTGTEVKSLRDGQVNLRDSFARIEGEEAFLHHCHINPYSHGNRQNPDPLRVRKLLLHKAEIRKLLGKVIQRGYTLVPTKIYFVKGRVKVELGLGRGKKLHDKREAVKAKEARREVERAFRVKR